MTGKLEASVRGVRQASEAALSVDVVDGASQASPFERFEYAILEGGGRMLGSAGKLGATASRLVVGYYVTGSGRPVILQRIPARRDGENAGGVEVFVPVCNSNRIDETLAALEQYAKGKDLTTSPAPDAYTACLVYDAIRLTVNTRRDLPIEEEAALEQYGHALRRHMDKGK